MLPAQVEPQPQPRPTVEAPETPFGAVITRQLSVWPFGARTLRLFLLVDPSLPDASLRRGVLRAMQQAYFRSDGCSQTKATREAALAAHYVLRHRNRDALPPNQTSAATVVAALRGDRVFVALAGDAAAFAWCEGALTGQRGLVRLPRPLGLEHDPLITLWSTRLDPEDQLILVCGATWRADSRAAIEDILGTSAGERAEERLAEALGGARPASVLIVDADGDPRPARHLTLVPTGDRLRVEQSPEPHDRETQAPRGWLRRWRGWLSSVVAAALLAVGSVAVLSPPAEPPRLSLLREAQTLLAEADSTGDAYQAHALAATALELAQRMGQPPAGAGEVSDLAGQATRKLAAIDRVYPVSPAMAVRLGPSGGNVVDVAVGEDALYTLDVGEASVRAFDLDARDQQPTPDTLVVRRGATVGARHLESPVAMQYLGGAGPGLGVLTIVDQARAVVQVGHDRALSLRQVPTSAGWRELGALGADADGRLFVLDSGSRRLLEYPPTAQRIADPPRLVLDGSSAPGLAFEKAAELVGQRDQVFLRMEDGTLKRFDNESHELAFVVRPPDGQAVSINAIAADRSGGLYLVDASAGRILHTTADGSLLRQLRDPSLAGLRLIQSSPDGRRLYGVVAAGVLVFDLPEEVPPPIQTP
jgi:hypothetical protein